ncbi:hypothetical protein NUV25_10505 [Burkholderia pseudomultivorans]|uniref:hypothetical protein n=1 Tax=Burkholderia pseudomultivorans TaxID=1207504 RepID=UPI0028750D3B|nr:hypothetical protein [Burkholderia pseudomultivorans]MDS0858139.1 hypothetical protein [Burkholderia pseudomultivorans]
MAKDFAEFDERAKTHIADPANRLVSSFYEKYREWRKAFEMAAQNGVVRFC